MFGGIGHFEWLVILVIVLIIFGAGKLPSVGGNLGKAIKNFRKGVKDETLPGDAGGVVTVTDFTPGEDRLGIHVAGPPGSAPWAGAPAKAGCGYAPGQALSGFPRL